VSVLARTFRGDKQKLKRRSATSSGSESQPVRSAFERARPFLIAALLVLFATAVTLVLLQSAGVIDISWLGGSSNPALPG
jgi:hypothetical protein